MIAEVENKSVARVHNRFSGDIRSLLGLPESSDDAELILVGSGKSAIAILLDFFRQSKQLKNKNSEVFFPQWIGGWVYNTGLKKCFPTNTLHEDTSGVMIYHQYGYPQKMASLMREAQKRNLFVIEDCAHALFSSIDGTRLGLLGDAGVFSFSKFFPSYTGGAILTKRRDIADFARAQAEKNSDWISDFSYWTKLLYVQGRAPTWMNKKLLSLIEMSYSAYDKCTVIHPRAYNTIAAELLNHSLERRRENSAYFMNELKGDSGLIEVERNEVVLPYVLPYLGTRKRLEEIRERFAKVDVQTGIYNFDVNRNMMSPEFKECIWIPVHPGVDSQLREKIIKILRIN